MRRPAAIVPALAILSLSVSLVSCGESEAEKNKAKREASARASAAKLQQARTDAAAKADKCQAAVEPLLDELQELESRLGVGMNFDKYSTRVSDLKVVYDDAALGDLKDLDCLQEVALPAEKAVQQYLRAYRVWQRCFEAIDCETDSVTPRVQKRWSKAAVYTTLAKSSIAGLRTPDGVGANDTEGAQGNESDTSAESETTATQRSADAEATEGDVTITSPGTGAPGKTSGTSFLVTGTTKLDVVLVTNVGGPNDGSHPDAGENGYPEYKVRPTPDGRWSQRVPIFPGENSIYAEDTGETISAERVIVGTGAASPPSVR